MLEPVDRHARTRARRARARRARRLRRAAAAVVLLAAAGAAAAMLLRPGSATDSAAPSAAPRPAAAAPRVPAPAPPATQEEPQPATARVEVPEVMRGVHVTMRLAATPGRLERYLAIPGLNTLQVDVKDESGLVAFAPASVPLVRELGASGDYYSPWRLAERVHERGVFLVGRVVTFQDSKLALQRPELAVQRADGSVWRNDGGKAWANPHDRRAWKYVVDVAAAAARAGFDEIQFDYVRFPSDGDVASAVYPGATETPPAEVIASFLRYASERLRPLGVRVSADVFGLAATLDVGIGQHPRLLAPYLDAIYPMAYPSHYRPGEYGLPDPNAAPGPTVAATMRDFRRELAGHRTAIIPWLQDFSLGRYYSPDDVRAQIDAALDGGSAGFLLWNASGEYTEEALSHRAGEP